MRENERGSPVEYNLTNLTTIRQKCSECFKDEARSLQCCFDLCLCLSLCQSVSVSLTHSLPSSLSLAPCFWKTKLCCAENLWVCPQYFLYLWLFFMFPLGKFDYSFQWVQTNCRHFLLLLCLCCLLLGYFHSVVFLTGIILFDTRVLTKMDTFTLCIVVHKLHPFIIVSKPCTIYKKPDILTLKRLDSRPGLFIT